MRTLIFLLAFAQLAMLLSACRSDLSETNRKTAMRWLDAMNHHDTAALGLLYADSARLESPNWDGVKTGTRELKTIFSRYFSSTPDLQQEMTHLITTDSAIVLEYRSWGRLLNPENNTPAYMRGKAYTLYNCTRMTLVDGKIQAQKTYFDQVSFLRQMGFFEER